MLWLVCLVFYFDSLSLKVMQAFLSVSFALTVFSLIVEFKSFTLMHGLHEICTNFG